MLQVIILIEIGHQYKILYKIKLRKLKRRLTIQKAGENKISKIGNIL